MIVTHKLYPQFSSDLRLTDVYSLLRVIITILCIQDHTVAVAVAVVPVDIVVGIGIMIVVDIDVVIAVGCWYYWCCDCCWNY